MPNLPIRRIRSTPNLGSSGLGPIGPLVPGLGPIGPLVPGLGPIGPLVPGLGPIGPLVPGSASIMSTVPIASSSTCFPVAMGWLPDVPDRRDLTLADVVKNKKKIRKKSYNNLVKLASKSELDPNLLPPIQDQGALESCTAHAITAMLEYLQRLGGEDAILLSRLFLFKATQNFAGVTGNTGAYIRDTIKAASLFGVPPEDRYQYIIANINIEPAAFLYAYASNYKALDYVRLDSDESAATTIANTKRVLMHGLPVAFGFTAYSNITTDPDIPMPGDQDKPLGGHAVLAVGYDNRHRIAGTKKIVEAIKIRNSWGPQWGEEGYGWLPCDYIRKSLACDFWSCFKVEW